MEEGVATNTLQGHVTLGVGVAVITISGILLAIRTVWTIVNMDGEMGEYVTHLVEIADIIRVITREVLSKCHL